MLRPDALLVVTMIFDTIDWKSGRSPKKVYEAVVRERSPCSRRLRCPLSRGFTMEEEQDRLLASLPGFMTTISPG